MQLSELQDIALKNGCDVTLDEKKGIAIINKIAVEADTIELPLAKISDISTAEFEKHYLPETLGPTL